jgi:hypothetical protein
MEIKGNISDIGEEVYIKAKLKYIKIDEKGVKYFISVPDEYLDGLTESEIMFKMPEPKPTPKIEIREKAKEIVKEARTEAPGKKRGRPKKATVDSLMRIADEVEAIENGKRFD